MKALILTETPIVSKRTRMIKEQLIKAGYEVIEKSLDENEPFTRCSFDFVVVDEMVKGHEDFKKLYKNPLDNQS